MTKIPSPYQPALDLDGLEQMPDVVEKRAEYNELWFKRLPVHLKKGESADLTLLKATAEWRQLHHVQNVNERGRPYRRFEQCQGEECWMCRAGIKAERKALYSVVDHRLLRYPNTYGEERMEQHKLRYLALSASTNTRFRNVIAPAIRSGSIMPVVRVKKDDREGYPWLEFDLLCRDKHLHALPVGMEPLNFNEVFDIEWRKKTPKGRRRRR